MCEDLREKMDFLATPLSADIQKTKIDSPFGWGAGLVVHLKDRVFVRRDLFPLAGPSLDS